MSSPNPPEPNRFNPDELTFTPDADYVLDNWTSGDMEDFLTSAGVPSIAELVMKLRGGLSWTETLSWIWVENRKRWPKLTYEDIRTIPMRKQVELVGSGYGTETDTPLEEPAAEPKPTETAS